MTPPNKEPSTLFFAGALVLFAAMVSLTFAIDAQQRAGATMKDAWREFDSGVSLAHHCDAEIDDHVYDYRWCIERLEGAVKSDSERAGLFFQAWVSAALASQHDVSGAAPLADTWSRARDDAIVRAKLTLSRACEVQRIRCRLLEKA
jgi:hypothetical protein